jgi:NAD(P)H dehydrogenase (quinone)
MTLIAVTGATGAIGGRVARSLAAHGADLRLVVRDPSRAPSLSADVRQAAYDDETAMRSAFAGAQTLFFVSASEDPDRVRLHTNVVDAAVAAGVERIVYLSFLNAAADSTFTFARDHWATEQRIRHVGLRHTFLRDAMYADFAPGLAGADRVIRGPGGDGAFTPVAQDDVAAVASAVLLAEGYDGDTLDLTGPERLTLTDVAAVLTDVTGKPVRYEEETVEEAYASRASYGAAQFEVDGWVSTYTAIAAGELDVLSPAVRMVTGHEPMSLRALLEARPELVQHLT